MMDAETKDRALDALMNHWREHGRAPASVHAFCRDLGIEERAFFETFASLDAAESAWWTRFLERVIGAVESGPEWVGFSARQRFLAFLFAFFEAAVGERSLFLLRLAPLRVLDRPAFLRGFEDRFESFAAGIVGHGKAREEIAERGRISREYPRVFYGHLRGCIAYWCKDESAKFERTDAFIEKTVALAFDLIGRQAVDSAVDLVRFLIPRRGW